MNRIREIANHGQSIWYDYIQRGMIWDGTLFRLVKEDGLKGVTSNPAIFEAAISKSNDYAPAIEALSENGASPNEMFETIAVEDIKMACDVLRSVYDETGGKDGFVSLEVSPHLAYDTVSTIEDGLRLWAAVARPNLMIKVPATEEGLPAIEELISEGVNVNITLLFAVDRYEAVFQRYQKGLERRAARGESVQGISSVASFFVSRIDAKVDKMIDERIAGGGDKAKLESLKGQVAIANAKMAYKSYEQMIAADGWKKLADAGAQVQRLLWASTSTKNPSFRDVLYIEELIGPDTVNTVPEKTYDAFQDHGEPKAKLKDGWDEAEQTMKQLGEVDISMKQVTDSLVEEGVVKFADAFDRLMMTVEQRREGVLGFGLAKMSESLGAYADKVKSRLEEMQQAGYVRRMWDRDPTLWTDDEDKFESISDFMGWLEVVDNMVDTAEHLIELQDDIADSGATHVLLMGMGGSSLAPDVFRRTFGIQPDSPELVVLDSTVPGQVRAAEAAIDPESTLFMVASKSGTTTEPLAFSEYFWSRTEKDGGQFVAITDPDSHLEEMALEREYFAIYAGDPEIGGRYSALSPFGMVPAAAMGLEPLDLLDRARTMVGSCEAAVPPAQNPGVRLGAILGELAIEGRDKLTIVTSDQLRAFGGWLEQLIAESTGKEGKGIIPVDGEALAAPSLYGSDRVFAHLKVKSEETGEVEAKLAELEKAGHPVLRFELGDARDLVQEMFRWEVATATASHVLKINPFDQPNVQESKDYTRELLGAHAKNGQLPDVPGEVKLLEEKGITLFTDEKNQGTFAGKKTLQEALEAHLGTVKTGDYVALNAYLVMNDDNDAALQAMRVGIRDGHKVATTVGFGPRFLHSTGQLHKGGANSGVFLQLTCDDAEDLDVPGESYSFGVLKSAQEAGDFMALSKRERRILRVHLGEDVAAGLDTLKKLLT